MNLRQSNLVRAPCDLLLSLAYGSFAIVAGSDSTDLFGDDGSVELALKVAVVVGLVLSGAAALVLVERIWGAAVGSLRWPKAEQVLTATFVLWFLATLIAARV